MIDADSFSGNQLKMLIKRLAKDMASDLEENVIPHTTSKGSRFYRALYKYPQIQELSAIPINSGHILIEINTYANPYPYIKQEITCFITDYLITVSGFLLCGCELRRCVVKLHYGDENLSHLPFKKQMESPFT